MMVEKENIHVLPDGRKLGYAVYGDKNRFPVLFFHGIPGSRLQQHPDMSILNRYPICIYALDRPGIGLSTHVKKRTLLDWTGDVLHFAERFEKFAIIGVSGGGPYSLACAYRFPYRLKHVSVISGLASLSMPDMLNLLRPRLKAAFISAKYAGFAIRPLLNKAFDLFQTRTEWAFENLFTVLPEKDLELMKEPDLVEMFKNDVAEAFRQGSKGVLEELRTLMRPWKFDPSDIIIPVQIWHGASDTMVPVAMAHSHIDRLKHGAAHIIEDGGHFMVMQHLEQIFSLISKDSEN